MYRKEQSLVTKMSGLSLGHRSKTIKKAKVTFKDKAPPSLKRLPLNKIKRAAPKTDFLLSPGALQRSRSKLGLSLMYAQKPDQCFAN